MLGILTIFLGALLVFLVQPLVGNTLLPTCGGTASVWSMCLAGFQILLVGGYFYAHVAETRFGRQGRIWHVVILTFAAVGLLVTICVANVHALPVQMVAVAIAYVALSANSSLVQALTGGRYRLYSVSNLGSLCGLTVYPFVFEYFLPISVQWIVFAVLVLAYAILFMALVARRSVEVAREATTAPRLSDVRPQPSFSTYFALSFVSCYLLNAVSTHLCADVTPLPMMWCALLAIYLLSYVVAFTDRGSQMAIWCAFIVIPVGFFGAHHLYVVSFSEYWVELVTGYVVLFFGGWMVHARLYRLRPVASALTRYYLMIALGGAAGGTVCSFVMPAISTVIAEYPIALGMLFVVAYLDWEWGLEWLIRKSARPTVTFLPLARKIAGVVLLIFVAYGLIGSATVDNGIVLRRFRNFYGPGAVVHKVEFNAMGTKAYECNEFRSNNTTHGFQVAEEDWKGLQPTCYYGEIAGGQAILNHPKYKAKKPMRVALCGMGIATLATYGQPGDFYRFYEINPAVAEVAKDESLFTFLSKSEAKVDVVIDDARKALERERMGGDECYDVIIVDVFNGDSIPSHMATREAFELYLDRLSPDGVLAMHLTNWHLDLKPMIKANAKEFGLKAKLFANAQLGYTFNALWAYLSRDEISIVAERGVRSEISLEKVRDMSAMTDEHHSLLPYLGKD